MVHDYTNHHLRATAAPIKLWEEGKTPLFDPSYGQDEPLLFPYLLKNKPDAGALIVCAGGAYTHRAYHCGEPIAEKFNSLGFHAFVLSYRVAPYVYPAAYLDLQRSVRTVRFLGKELGVNPEKVGVMGFSAGGHLCSTAALSFDYGDPAASDPIEMQSSRPDAAILCYSVLSFLGYSHQGSVRNLLGENPGIEMRRQMSAEINVKPDTPPIFLWHTARDEGVSPMNSLMLAEALIQRGITCALHIYPNGGHGIGLATEKDGRGGDNFQAVHWPEEAARFLKDEGF